MAKRHNTRSIFSWITTIYIFMMLTVFIFFCGSNGYVGIMDAKYNIFCILCCGYILIMTVVALESVIVGTIKPCSPLALLKASSWSQRLVILYLLLTWISALLSPYFPETVLGISRQEGALTITIYGLSFLLISIYGKASEGMLWVLGVTTLLFSSICLLQIAGYNPLSLFPAGVGYADRSIAYSGAYLGTIGNTDLVAAFFCLSIPIMWVSLLRLNKKRRFLLILPLVVSLVTLLCMDVVAGLIGVLAGGILTIPIVLQVNAKCKRRIWAAMILFGIAATAILYIVDFGSGFLHELHEILHGRVDTAFGSGRIQIWNEVLQKIPKNLLFGAGPDTMIRAGLQGFSKIKETLGTIVVARIDAAHNEYLNVLYHQGILALLSYLGALILLARKWIKYSSEDATTAILGAAACSYCIQAMFGISMFIVAPLFWLVLGLLEGRSSTKYIGGHKK